MTSISSQTAETKARGGIKGLAKGRSDVFSIDPRIIEIDPEFNARDFTSPSNIEHVKWLEGSIEAEGIKEPLKVRTIGNRIIVTNGESRLRAVRNLIARYDASGGKEGANIESVPVRTEDRTANDEDRLFTQLTSNSGKRFEVLEQADLFLKMVKLGVSVETIATRANLDKRRVTALLDYQALPSEVKQMIREERVTASLAWKSFLAHQRDDDATIAEMRGAIENAEAAGRTKASGKFVGGSGGQRTKSEKMQLRDEKAQLLSERDEMAAIIRNVISVDNDEDEGQDLSIISMKTADWNRLFDLLKLEAAN